MPRRILKALAGVVAVIFFASLLVRFPEHDRADRDILLRRRFLLTALDARKTFFRSMNDQFAGEWALVTYSMATFALTNICMRHPELVDESAKAIASWIEVCLTPGIRRFDEVAWGENPLDEAVLESDEGHIGYYGHVNLMLACYGLLVPDGRFKDLNHRMNEAIARRMRKRPHRHVETYPGQNYPPDNSVSVASLSLASQTQGGLYNDLVAEWMAKTRNLAEKSGGLVPFQINTLSGEPVQGARGSNNGWNSFFLPLIDEKFARAQYFFLKNFYSREGLGLAAMKEFRTGHWFTMDCDTGPVMFGLGATATAFSIAGAKRHGDELFAGKLLRSVELLATTITQGDRRKYAATPVLGDAIILAMKTACPWRALGSSRS